MESREGGEGFERRRCSLGGRRRKSHDVIIPPAYFQKNEERKRRVAGVDEVGKPTSSSRRAPTPEDPDADGDLPSSFRRSRGPELADRSSSSSSSSSSAYVTGTDSESQSEEDNEDDFRVEAATEGPQPGPSANDDVDSELERTLPVFGESDTGDDDLYSGEDESEGGDVGEDAVGLPRGAVRDVETSGGKAYFDKMGWETPRKRKRHDEKPRVVDCVRKALLLYDKHHNGMYGRDLARIIDEKGLLGEGRTLNPKYPAQTVVSSMAKYTMRFTRNTEFEKIKGRIRLKWSFLNPPPPNEEEESR